MQLKKQKSHLNLLKVALSIQQLLLRKKSHLSMCFDTLITFLKGISMHFNKLLDLGTVYYCSVLFKYFEEFKGLSIHKI